MKEPEIVELEKLKYVVKVPVWLLMEKEEDGRISYEIIDSAENEVSIETALMSHLEAVDTAGLYMIMGEDKRK